MYLRDLSAKISHFQHRNDPFAYPRAATFAGVLRPVEPAQEARLLVELFGAVLIRLMAGRLPTATVAGDYRK
jgi:hypothetical protein